MAIDDGIPHSCTVTFGRSSFIGRSLVSALLNSGDWTVRIADPLPPPPDPFSDPFLSDSIRSGRASYRQVDIRSRSQARSAAEGSSVVFHLDPTSAACNANDFYQNHLLIVQGTRNVVAACLECGVERLVFTGTADVVFDGVKGIEDGDETMPYPDRHVDKLNELRAQAEAVVLSVDGRNGLLTCALRPSNVFGPGDENLVPFLVAGARSGWLKFIIGNGKNMCDFTYVENVAHANIYAERALNSKISSVSGKPFFITNNEPMGMWAFVSKILEGFGYQRPIFRVPLKFVLLMALLVEWVRDKFGICRSANSHITLSVIHSLSCTKTFNCSQSQRHVGYLPIVSLEDGIRSTVESFPQLEKGAHYLTVRDFSEPSKAYKLLGSGAVADILLWRDDKKTFTCLLAFFLVSCRFLLCGRTFISSVSELLLAVAIILFVQGILPSSMLGFITEKTSSSYFEISELNVQHSFTALASLWNRGIWTLRSLAEGDDWIMFFKERRTVRESRNAVQDVERDARARKRKEEARKRVEEEEANKRKKQEKDEEARKKQEEKDEEARKSQEDEEARKRQEEKDEEARKMQEEKDKEAMKKDDDKEAGKTKKPEEKKDDDEEKKDDDEEEDETDSDNYIPSENSPKTSVHLDEDEDEDVPNVKEDMTVAEKTEAVNTYLIGRPKRSLAGWFRYICALPEGFKSVSGQDINVDSMKTLAPDQEVDDAVIDRYLSVIHSKENRKDICIAKVHFATFLTNEWKKFEPYNPPQGSEINVRMKAVKDFFAKPDNKSGFTVMMGLLGCDKVSGWRHSVKEFFIPINVTAISYGHWVAAHVNAKDGTIRVHDALHAPEEYTYQDTVNPLAAVFIYLFKSMLAIPLLVLVSVGVICLFSLFIVYEQYEDETEKVLATIIIGVKNIQKSIVRISRDLTVRHLQ